MSGSDEGAPAVEILARLLRQRREMGEDRLFLRGMTRPDLEVLVARIRGGVAPPASPSSPSRGAEPSAGAVEADPSAGAGESDPGPGPVPDTEELSPGERAVRLGEDGENVVGGLGYDRLRAVALGCRRCRLAEGRTQVVFSDGNPEGRLMVVGEAPGAREDETGLPFVGPAGKLLDLLLASVDLSREESVYICNVLKCRPPGNRDPLPDEIEACTPYLRRQIDLVSPEVILGVGKFAGQFLTGRSSALGKLRGEVYSYEGVPLVVTYHPAALLRNSSWTRATWDDFQLVRRILDGA